MKFKFLKKAVAFVTAVTMSLGALANVPAENLSQFMINAYAETGDYLNIESSLDDTPINIGDEFWINATLHDASGSMKYTSYDSFDWFFTNDDGSKIDTDELYCSTDYSYDILSFIIIPLKAKKYNLTVRYNDDIVKSLSFEAVNKKEILASGDCGVDGYYMQDVNYVVDNKNTLTISGNGYMSSYSFSGPSGTNFSDSRAPWFPFWKYIENINVEGDIEIIGAYAFYNCSKLLNVNITDSVTKIGNAAFYKCSSLKTINLPEGLEKIGNNAFGETLLSEVVIPDNVSSIDDYAFLGCTELKKVIIPKNTYIGTNSFGGCSQLTIYGYDNSPAEIYANENNIPFISLDEERSYTEDDLLNAIKEKSGKEIVNSIYVDFNHDGNKEMLALIPLDSFNREVWFCSSDASKCYYVEKISYGSDYCDLKEIVYSNESHVLYNSGNNFGNGQYFAIYSYKNDEIKNELTHMGIATVNENNIVQVTTRGYDENGVADVSEKSYSYDLNEQKYSEIAETPDTETYTVTYIGENDEVIYTKTLKIGETAIYDSDTYSIPVSSTGYNFRGWGINKDDIIPQSETYTGENGNITYYALFGEVLTVNWYNGAKLLETTMCIQGNVPVYNGKLPEYYADEYGLKREFLGWTTTKNEDYKTTIPEKLSPISSDTSYYAVFSSNDPDTDVTEDEVYDIDYIEQHIRSAGKREWDYITAAINIKDIVENSSLEVTHGIWETITITDKAVNLDYMGIYGEISANDYNLILLDMFNSVEGYEKSASIIQESTNKGVKEWLDIIKGCLNTALGDNLKLNKELDSAYDDFSRSGDFTKLTKKISDIFSENDVTLDFKIEQSMLTTYKLSSDVLNGLDTAITTFEDVVKNAETIAAYRAYCNMSDEYVILLKEMYYAADNISGNSWEVADLKNAIRYAIYYHTNPDEEALNGIVNNIAKNMTNIIAKGMIDDIIEEQTINFIQTTFTKDVTGVSKSLKAEIGGYVAAVQSGFKYGVKISDKLFDMNNREELYVKIKEYGVLNEVLTIVLNNRASKLLSANTLKEQYSAAQFYDKAYKMYMFTEIEAANNVAKYEKTFENTLAIKAILAIINPANIIYYNYLDENATRHIENAAVYEEYAKYMKNNARCHNEYTIDENEYIDVLINYNMTMKEHKVVIVNCPVRVNVYDKNKILVGTLSAGYTNVTPGYESYIYRIEETDSNIVCVPTDYTIEIIGLEEGTMRVIGSYFNNGEQINTVSYNNIPIDSDYNGVFDIDEDSSTLDCSDDMYPDNHIHSYSTIWSKGNTSHWHECSCGKKKDVADHISDNGKVTVKPTATSSGTKTYSCAICGYVIRTETIPATGSSENNGGNGNTGSYVPPTTVPSYTPTFPTTIVTRPTLTVKATTKNDTVTLKWNKINNAKKYTVYQLVNGKYVKIKDTDKTSVTFKKLKSGKTYKFLVRYTVNGQKSSNAYSGRISVTVNYKPVVKATATQNSVKLVWDDVPNAQKYAVYKYVNGKAVKLIETKKTSIKINKLAPKTKYQYIVRAYINGKWTTMTKSDIVTATTK